MESDHSSVETGPSVPVSLRLLMSLPPSPNYEEKGVNKEMDEDGNGILPIPDSGYTTSGEKLPLLHCHWEQTLTLVVTVCITMLVVSMEVQPWDDRQTSVHCSCGKFSFFFMSGFFSGVEGSVSGFMAGCTFGLEWVTGKEPYTGERQRGAGTS